MFKTVQEVRDFCEKNEVAIIDFMMVDMLGRWRHLSMPIERFNEDTMRNGIGFDGSSYGYSSVEMSDMVFIPDLSSAHVNAFTAIPTLSMIGDVYELHMPENKRFDQYPRNVAVHAEEYMRKLGVADEMWTGPEFEFHVFDHMSYTLAPNHVSFRLDTEQAEWHAGDEAYNSAYHIPKKGGYHAALPYDKLGDFRSRVTMIMEEMGIKVKYHHHEVGGAGQQEVEVEFGGMREMADKTMLAKYIIKNAAAAEGKTVTFMPKPLYGEPGNGLHIHLHLFKDGKPLFYDKDGYAQLSELAHYFMGGLLKHSPALCAFTNPSTNSYKRLIPGFEAPVTIGYATSNRSSVIRIPAYAKDPDKKRFEFRNPDGTCNPYYAYAAILMAGLDGVNKKIDPRKEGYGPFDCNLFDLPEEELKKIKKLPRNLDEALDALEADHAFLLEDGVFPKKLIELWVKHKRAEAARYNQMVQPIEFELYYDL